MNKKIVLFSIVFLATLCIANAQNGFGIKAGLSYNSNGDLKDFTSDVEGTYKDKGNGKSGYNFGFYAKLDLGPIYLRPELVYIKTTSEYELNSGTTEDYKISKLDMPILVGFKVIGPLDVFIGPAFQYYLDNDLTGLRFNEIENDFSVGINIGASVEIGRIGIDVRYERGLNKNEAEFQKDILGDPIPTYRLDSRPEQIIFSLSYRLSHKKA